MVCCDVFMFCMLIDDNDDERWMAKSAQLAMNFRRLYRAGLELIRSQKNQQFIKYYDVTAAVEVGKKIENIVKFMLKTDKTGKFELYFLRRQKLEYREYPQNLKNSLPL